MRARRERAALWGYLLGPAVLVGAATEVQANGRFPAANELVVDPTDEAHVVVRTTFGLVQTFDAGASWSWICESAVAGNTGFQDPPLVVAAEGAILLGLDDGVHVGTGSGCQWSVASSDFAHESVIDMTADPRDPSRAFAATLALVGGALNGRVLRTDDGGREWMAAGPLLENASPVTIEVAPSRSARIYLGALDGNLENGFVAVSDDGGATWIRHPAPAGPDSVYLSGVDPLDPDRLYARSIFPMNALYVSRDGATSWTLIYSATTALAGFALSPDGERIAVGGDRGLVLLARGDDEAGAGYAVVSTTPLAVSCLRWDRAGLFACATDSAGAADGAVSGGFSVGRSADGSSFTPLLRFRDLSPAACPENPLLRACATDSCSIGMLFDASCAPTSRTPDASSVIAGKDGGDAGMPDGHGTSGGCACRAAGATDDRPRWQTGVAIVLAAMAWRGRRRLA
jgi:MYXO-CTERM domain-containing protein